jgi:hypothetical protein
MVLIEFSPFSWFFNPSSPNPKHAKRRVEEIARDDTVKEQDVPSIIVDP